MDGRLLPRQGGHADARLGLRSPCRAAYRRGSRCTAQFGKLPFRKLFEQAIRYGREGFLVSPTIARQWQGQVDKLKDQPGFAQAFLPGGRASRGRKVRLQETCVGP